MVVQPAGAGTQQQEVLMDGVMGEEESESDSDEDEEDLWTLAKQMVRLDCGDCF
jgi:hypothetical protein